MRQWVRHHALLLYFALAFAISWIGVLAIVGGTVPADSGPESTRLRLWILPAMVAGPVAAALLLTSVVGGARGLRVLLARQLRWRVGATWYAALLIAPVALVLVLGLLSLVAPAFAPAILSSDDPGTLATMALVAGLTAGFFEELGWTGFATPRLLRRHGVLATGILLGIPWAIWHALPDYWGSAPGFGSLWSAHFVQWIVALVGFRVLMTWVYRHTGSLLVGQLMHVSFTGGQFLLWPATSSPIDEILWYGLFALAMCVAAGAALARERHLRRLPAPGLPPRATGVT